MTFLSDTCWGGPTPFLPMEKCVFSHFCPWGKMGKKYMERKVKVFISLSFHILFSPWGKIVHGPPRVPFIQLCGIKEYPKKQQLTEFHLKLF